MADGKVTFEIRSDDSKLESDLGKAEKKVEKSAEKAADKSEKVEKESSETKKKVKEDVTKHHEQENEKQEKSDEQSHKNREESAKNHGERLKSITSNTAKAIGAGLLAAGTTAVSIGTMAVNSAVDMKQAMNQFIASTGKGTEETERYQNVLEGIYKNNYGDGFGDIADAMTEVTKKIGELDDASLQNVTESAFALRDTFGYDIPESTRAAKAMMDNFGISADEAMNLIAAGAQNGLDYSGELIDSINEYSVQFAKVGLDADDMFKIFEKGAESGAWNLDKIGDAVKEFSIRAIDGSQTTAEGFKAIGLDADTMAKKFAAGGDTAKQAFKDTINALSAMKDPIAQNTAGVALFGTMWEDLGPEAVAALADIQDGLYGTGEEMENLKAVKYDDLGSMFEGLKRSVELLLLPLGEQLIPLLSELIESVMPVIEEILPPLTEAAGDLIDGLMPIIDQILPVITDLISELLPPLMEIIEQILPVLIDVIDAILPILTSLIDILGPILELFMELLAPILDLISEALVPLISVISELIDFAIDPLMQGLEILFEVFKTTFSGILKNVSATVGSVTKVLQGIIQFIKGVFTGNWRQAWEGIKNIFSGIVSGIANIFKAPINFIIDGINKFINGINKVKIPDWVPAVGGMGFHIPTIPRLRIGMDYVPSDDFPALLHKGEAVLTAEENAKLKAMGGLSGVENILSMRQAPGAQKIIIGKHSILVQTVLDGKVAAETMAPYIDTELGNFDETRKRGG